MPSLHTPEYIESLTDIEAILSVSDELHADAPKLLSTPLPSAEVERELRLRTAIKLKLDEQMGDLATSIAKQEAKKRELRNVKGYQTSDEERLESYMFQRLRDEKRGQA